MAAEFGPRRAVFVEAAGAMPAAVPVLPAADLAAFESFDLFYRALCALLFNYVPTSGHPGGFDLDRSRDGGPCLRRPRLRPGRSRTRRRRRAVVCGRPQGHGALRPLGVARRDRPRGGARAAAGRPGAAPATRGPPGFSPQPDGHDAALGAPARPGSGSATPRRPRRSCAWRPAPRASVSRPRSAWRSPLATATARVARACTSARVRAASRRDA